MLAIPTFFDLIATVLMNIGLLSVTASVYQMMRGAEMLFAALFSITFLHRSLNRFHLMGILCCMVSAISFQLPPQLVSLAAPFVAMSACHPIWLHEPWWQCKTCLCWRIWYQTRHNLKSALSLYSVTSSWLVLTAMNYWAISRRVHCRLVLRLLAHPACWGVKVAPPMRFHPRKCFLAWASSLLLRSAWHDTRPHITLVCST